MKLVRFGDSGQEKPGLVDGNGRIRDLSGVVGDIAGDVLGPERLNRLKAIDPETLPLVEGNPRLGAPVGAVPKFFGIGLNYRDHAEETGLPIPEVPIVFYKATSCVSGPNDAILAPAQVTLTGRVTTPAALRPISGATVLLTGTPHSATTAADGSYTLIGVPPQGSFTVRVSAEGFGTVERELTVSEPPPVLDVALPPLAYSPLTTLHPVE